MNILSMRRVLVYRASLCGALIFSSCFATRAQEVIVEHNVNTSQAGGWHAQYEMHVDPENARNMIVCGYKFDAKDNALYGYVYSSSDQGRTWPLAFEPKNSTFESEQSCAYGVHGIAYYITSSSKLIDDDAHHEQGTTRIYVSHNSGKNWTLGVKTGWNDWTSSVVDTAPGPNQNRLYVFFNANDFYPSLGQARAGEAQIKQSSSTGSWMAMISYRGGESQITGPAFVTAPTEKKYTRGGSYPAPTLLLRDGTILTLNTTKRRTETNTREILIEAIRTTPDRTGLEAPVKVVSSLDSPTEDNTADITCGNYFLDSAASYDATHDTVYFAYGAVLNKKCQLMLTRSTDGGKSWQKPQAIRNSAADGEQEFAFPAIAIGKDGLLALMWQKTYRSGCWMFATSPDDGKSMSRATPLGTCTASEMKPSRLNTAYLWDSFFQADPNNPNSTASINLRNSQNNLLGKNQNAIVMTPDGVFHALWSDAGHGEGELRTAAITVTPAATLISNATAGLTDVTTKVAVLYGGDQFYDPKTKLITLDIAIKNKSPQPLIGPFKLAVPRFYKEYGFAEIANADNKVSLGGAVWDISTDIPGGKLAPGATSKPFTLKFRYLADEDTPRASDDILGLSVKVFAAK